ncbi:MAG: hypothetical protein R3F43_33025, partial [bacterium]
MRIVTVISDLHLGGRFGHGDDRGFRMMTRPDALAAYIRSLARGSELVINGDFVDFLAEEGVEGAGWTPFVADQAAVVERLATLMGAPLAAGEAPPAGRSPDALVFDALADHLTAGGELTLLLGNHDLELGLPAARGAVVERLGPGGGRTRFVLDGEAYLVGDALIEHGNRYDGFNVVNQDAFRQLRSLLSRGHWPADAQRISAFEAPLG